MKVKIFISEKINSLIKQLCALISDSAESGDFEQINTLIGHIPSVHIRMYGESGENKLLTLVALSGNNELLQIFLKKESDFTKTQLESDYIQIINDDPGDENLSSSGEIKVFDATLKSYVYRLYNQKFRYKSEEVFHKEQHMLNCMEALVQCLGKRSSAYATRHEQLNTLLDHIDELGLGLEGPLFKDQIHKALSYSITEEDNFETFRRLIQYRNDIGDYYRNIISGRGRDLPEKSVTLLLEKVFTTGDLAKCSEVLGYALYHGLINLAEAMADKEIDFNNTKLMSLAFSGCLMFGDTRIIDFLSKQKVDMNSHIGYAIHTLDNAHYNKLGLLESFLDNGLDCDIVYKEKTLFNIVNNINSIDKTTREEMLHIVQTFKILKDPDCFNTLFASIIALVSKNYHEVPLTAIIKNFSKYNKELKYLDHILDFYTRENITFSTNIREFLQNPDIDNYDEWLFTTSKEITKANVKILQKSVNTYISNNSGVIEYLKNMLSHYGSINYINQALTSGVVTTLNIEQLESNVNIANLNEQDQFDMQLSGDAMENNE